MATGARRQRRVSEEDDTDPGITDPFLQVPLMSTTSDLGEKITLVFLGRGRLHTNSEWTHEAGKNRQEQ